MTRRRDLLALTLIVLLGFALRVHLLGQQGIWGDEAFSIATARLSLRAIIDGKDTLPPLFNILLRFWMQATGDSEFAIRYLALMPGWLLIPTAYVLGKQSLNGSAGLLTASTAAVSAFGVYYSQEARMYSLAAFLTAISVYSFLRLIKLANFRGRAETLPFWRALYFLFTLLAMYSHYYVFFVIAAQNLFAVWIGRKRLRWLAQWSVIQASLGILYLPWVLTQAGDLAGRASQRLDAWGPQGMVQVWGKSLIAFAAGRTIPESLGWAALGMSVFGVLGIAVTIQDRRENISGGFIILYLAIPMLIAWAVGPFMPFFQERYLLMSLPAYWVLTVGGIVFLSRSGWKWLAGIGLAGIVVFNGYGLANYYYDSQYTKSNYREILAYIRSHLLPDDTLILLNPEQDALFAYYGRNMPMALMFPTRNGYDLQAVQKKLAKIERDYQRVWLIAFGNAPDWDPGRVVQTWLNEHSFRAYHEDYEDGALELYVIGTVEPSISVEANFSGLIALTGYGVNTTTLAPGDTLQLALAWQALGKMDRDYMIFTHIVDGQQQISGQVDGPPGNGALPTSGWATGEESIDRFALKIDPTTPPGTYWLEIGWYELETLQRLLVLDDDGNPAGDKVVLIQIEIR